MKIVKAVNWILISIWAMCMLYALFSPSGNTDAAGRGQESAIKILGFFILIILVLLNILPYAWTRVPALVIGILLALLILYFKSN